MISQFARSALSLGLSLAFVACQGQQSPLVPGSSADSTGAYVREHGVKPGIVRYASGGFSLTLTPNYKTEFGTLINQVTCHSLPCAKITHGSLAVQGGGDVDFGAIYGGQDYVYRNAVSISITTPGPYFLYGEVTSASGISGSQLFWAPSNPKNGPWTSGFAFAVNSTPGDGSSFPIHSGKTGPAVLGYDYIIRPPSVLNPIGVSVQVVYTVVGS